jgi:hypothetical protein
VTDLDEARQAAADAKAAYQANPDDPDAKTTHRDASQWLNDARWAARGGQADEDAGKLPATHPAQQEG